MGKGKKLTLFHIYEVTENSEGKVIKKTKLGYAFKDEIEAKDYCKYINELYRDAGLKFAYFKEDLSVYNYAEDLIKKPNAGLFV